MHYQRPQSGAGLNRLRGWRQDLGRRSSCRRVTGPRRSPGCLAALERQTVDDFEVVVVDDRSRSADAVRAVVDRVRACTARRRRGAGSGRGAQPRGGGPPTATLVCFTDDDCRPGTAGCAALGAALRRRRRGRGRADARGRRRRRPRVADRHQPPRRRIARRERRGRVRADEQPRVPPGRHRRRPVRRAFPAAAGEDRAWCDRLQASRAPDRVRRRRHGCCHDRRSTVRGFWRQHVRYGAGAYRYFRAATVGAARPVGAFYARLLRAGSPTVLATGVLVVLTQAATAVGLAGEAYRARRRTLKQRLAADAVDGHARQRGGGGGDVLEPRRSLTACAARAAPGTTSAHASPSVWLPDRPLPTPWRCTVPNSSERTPVKRVAGRSVQRTTRSGSRSARVPGRELARRRAPPTRRRARRRDRGTCAGPRRSRRAARRPPRGRRCRRARGRAG